MNQLKCPNCGNPQIQYKIKRKKNNETKDLGKRVNFEIEKCPKCGFEGEIKEEEFE